MYKKIILKKILFLAFLSAAFTPITAQIKQPVDYVDPLIGTEKSTHLTMWESKGAASIAGFRMSAGTICW